MDIWDRAFTPPEGKKAINGFLFDIFCVGHAYASYFLYVCSSVNVAALADHNVGLWTEEGIPQRHMAQVVLNPI